MTVCRGNWNLGQGLSFPMTVCRDNRNLDHELGQEVSAKADRFCEAETFVKTMGKWILY